MSKLDSAAAKDGGTGPGELEQLYARRFSRDADYRNRVWRTIIAAYFSRFIGPNQTVLDLGCGYGQFINNLRCGKKLAMDLNPQARQLLAPDVTFIEQDCMEPWGITDSSVDVIFTSNFFEHLPSKSALFATVTQAHRCLRSGGKLIAMGPNIRFTGGAYWDFWDHRLALTEASLQELCEAVGFKMRLVLAKFLPYSMVREKQYPMALIAAYLKMPIFWRIFGKQFLLIAQRGE
jgi:SAM-dependent methyltransferase